MNQKSKTEQVKPSGQNIGSIPFSGLPEIPHETIFNLLSNPSSKTPKKIIIDTDTYNEIDDQFALVHMLLVEQSREDIEILCINSAPFHNTARNTDSYEHGMELSYQEIFNVLNTLDTSWKGEVLKGSKISIQNNNGSPVVSPASEKIIELALKHDKIYIIALGALTNITSAIFLNPEIRSRIVVCTLGGSAFTLHGFSDFNHAQDVLAAQRLFSSGTPVIHFPGWSVTDHLRTSRWELEANLGSSKIGEFLYKRYLEFVEDFPGRSKPIWDLAPGGWILDPTWYISEIRETPELTDKNTWVDKPANHPIRTIRWMNRDQIFKNFFELINPPR